MSHQITDIVRKGSIPIIMGTSQSIIDNTKGLKGQVSCFYQDRDPITGKWGDLIQHHFKSNLIVKLARNALANLIADPSESANYSIATMRFGLDGQDGGDPLVPVAPLPLDTGLYSSFYSHTLVPASEVSYEPIGDPTAVRFTVTLTEGVANHAVDPSPSTQVYTEAGLFCANGDLFARETFPSLVKTDSRRITFEWLILF